MANKGIDLDSLEVGNATVQENPVEAPVAGAVPTAQPKQKTVNAMFDKYKKMVFLFDVSGSMGDGMLPDDIDKMYFWNEDILQSFLDRLWSDLDAQFQRRYFGPWEKPTPQDFENKNAEVIGGYFKTEILTELLMAGGDDSVDEESLEKLVQARVDSLSEQDRKTMKFFFTYGIEPVISENLKYLIVRKQLHHQYSLDLRKVPGYVVNSMAKMDVMKKAASAFIKERFDKNPEAQVLAYAFDHQISLLSNEITADALLKAVDQMHPTGGTDIYQAVSIALKEFNRAPSAVGSHHIVLVTDAESSDGEAVESLLPKLKDAGIVLDFIQVRGTIDSEHPTTRENAEILKRVCKMTGGDYTEVNTPSDFTQKFLAAANRLCLPPKRS